MPGGGGGASAGLFFLTMEYDMENIEIYRQAGAACDRYIALRLAEHLGGDCEMVDDVPGVTAMIEGQPVHIKTTAAVPGHILFEHTGKDDQPGWMHGPAEIGCQVSGTNRVYVWDMAAAASWVVERFGEPGEHVEPEIPENCKVPEVWLSRYDRHNKPIGDLFIYVHAHDLHNSRIGTWMSIPALDSVVRLCKNARNTHQPLELRLAALERLKELTR